VCADIVVAQGRAPAPGLGRSLLPGAGPVERAGAIGTLVSIYTRDPDGSLIELARHDPIRGFVFPPKTTMLLRLLDYLGSFGFAQRAAARVRPFRAKRLKLMKHSMM
jgi:hypothetical protein